MAIYLNTEAPTESLFPLEPIDLLMDSQLACLDLERHLRVLGSKSSLIDQHGEGSFFLYGGYHHPHSDMNILVRRCVVIERFLAYILALWDSKHTSSMRWHRVYLSRDWVPRMCEALEQAQVLKDSFRAEQKAHMGSEVWGDATGFANHRFDHQVSEIRALLFSTEEATDGD